MASSAKGFVTMVTPAPEDSSPEANVTTAVAVRSEDWAKVLSFISVQASVLNAAVPQEMYGIQALAKELYKSLEPIINKYKHADDMVEVEVELDGGARQKTLISDKALFTDNEAAGAPQIVKSFKDKAGHMSRKLSCFSG